MGQDPSIKVDAMTSDDTQFLGQLEAARYLFVASLAAFIWDLLCALGQDYRLLTRYPVNWPTIVYFVSRISTLAFVATCTAFYVSPTVGSCRALQIALGCCWVVAAPSTSLLFFFRVRAMFDRQRAVIICSAILWLATLGGSITIPFALEGMNIGDTGRCMVTTVRSFASAPIIASACYDTLVFIAVSWNIVMHASVTGKVRSFFGGRDLPYISRELLQGGQLYYLITVGGNVLSMAVILSPATPAILRTMVVVPDLALENSMACRVFRNIKLGSTFSGNSHEANNTLPGVSAYALRTFGGTEIKRTREPEVEISKTVEHFDDGGEVHIIIRDQGAESSSSTGEAEFV